MQALPHTIQQCLSRWQIEWTGESLKQGYFGYVLPCQCQDGTPAILKLSPLAQEAQAQVIALSAWAGNGAPRLLAESCDDHGGSLLIGRIMPGAALWPRDDPDGQRIAECLQRLAGVPASSTRGSLPFGLQRLVAQLSANACHLHALSPASRRHHDAMMTLAHAVARSQRPREQAVLLHGDLHAGNLLLASAHKSLRFCDLCKELGIGPCGCITLVGQISEQPAENGRLGDAALPVCLGRTIASECDPPIAFSPVISNSLPLRNFHHQFLESWCRSQTLGKNPALFPSHLSSISPPGPLRERLYSAKISRALWLVRFSR
jgi:hypothetical protein